MLNAFRIIAALIVLAGSVMEFGLVWSTADVLMGFMALINLPVIIILGCGAEMYAGLYAAETAGKRSCIQSL